MWVDECVLCVCVCMCVGGWCRAWLARLGWRGIVSFPDRQASLQYQSSFQSSTLIGRAVTRSQTSLGVRARFRLGFRAGYDVFRMYAVLISTNQIQALKITPG